jgi:putative hydrolase of the HAD superfamily
MIKNIIFDFGNIICKCNIDEITEKYTNNPEEIKFIKEQVVNSEEWVGGGLIDLGEITLSEAASSINKKTNYIYKDLVNRFLSELPNNLKYNGDILNLVKELKNKGYKVYVLSNTANETFANFKDDLEALFDGLVLSYKIHEIKPNKPIYEYLLRTYNLNPNECLFLDDREDNIMTANELGIHGRKVNEDDLEDIINVLKEYSVL